MGLISYAFNSAPPKDLGLLANNVVTNMKADKQFESLKPEVLILESLYLPFWNAYTEALKGGDDRRNLRESLEIPLLKQMNKVGHFVDAVAGDDVAIAQASGFKLKKTTRAAKSSAKDLTPPINVKITNVEGKLGWATLTWSGSEGSKSYDVEFRIPVQQGVAEWSVPKHTTKQSMTFTDLPLGKYVEFHVSSYGSGETESDFSSIVGIWAS